LPSFTRREAIRAGSYRRGGQMPRSAKHIVRSSLGSGRPSKTDLRRLRALTDQQIADAVASDPDAVPDLDAAWFAAAEVVLPPEKQIISIRVDKDVLNFFRRSGPGYQTRINAVLRAFMEHGPKKRKAG
jgi:uncharacterized protein (DUF4415 family)